MSTATGNLFTDSAARRIVAATRSVESETVDLSDQDTPTVIRPGTSVWVMIVGNPEPGLGVYDGQFLTPPTADISPSADAASPAFGSTHAPTYGSVKVINAGEIGNATGSHTLKAGDVLPGRIIRRQTDGTIWVGVRYKTTALGVGKYQVQSLTYSGTNLILTCWEYVYYNWAGTTPPTPTFQPQNAPFLILAAQGHAVGDIVYAVKMKTPNNAVGSPNYDGFDYVEMLQLPTSGSVGMLVQIVDSTGRYGVDWLRAHA